MGSRQRPRVYCWCWTCWLRCAHEQSAWMEPLVLPELPAVWDGAEHFVRLYRLPLLRCCKLNHSWSSVFHLLHGVARQHTKHNRDACKAANHNSHLMTCGLCKLTWSIHVLCHGLCLPAQQHALAMLPIQRSASRASINASATNTHCWPADTALLHVLTCVCAGIQAPTGGSTDHSIVVGGGSTHLQAVINSTSAHNAATCFTTAPAKTLPQLLADALAHGLCSVVQRPPLSSLLYTQGVCQVVLAVCTHHHADADHCIKLARLGHRLGNNRQLKAAGHPAHLGAAHTRQG